MSKIVLHLHIIIYLFTIKKIPEILHILLLIIE